jgi:predicted Zn-dependent peptidase
VLVGYKGISFLQRDEASLNILATILSNGESSRLYKSLVYDKEIAAEVDASNMSLLDPGLFIRFAGRAPLRRAMAATLSESRRVMLRGTRYPTLLRGAGVQAGARPSRQGLTAQAARIAARRHEAGDKFALLPAVLWHQGAAIGAGGRRAQSRPVRGGQVSGRHQGIT